MPNKKNTIKMYVSDEEFARISEAAKRTGLSLSAFTKKVALGCVPRSLEHAHVRHELRLLRGDLGRIGGLIKQSLAHEVVNKHSVYRHLTDLDALKAKIDAAVEQCS